MLKLRVPHDDQLAVSLISRMTDEQYERFISALKEVKPSYIPEKVVSRIAPSAQQLSFEEVQKIFGFGIRLFSTAASFPGTSDDLAASIVHSLDPNLSGVVDVKDDERGVIIKRLTSMLALDKTLGIMAKTQNILTSYERNIISTEMLTDIRPVFTKDADELPPAAFVVHTLKLTFTQNDTQQDMYFAMDSIDVEILREVLDRADLKEKQLDKVIAGAGMSNLGAGGD